MTGKDRELRKNYCHFLQISTRWLDNDLYGHVSDVVCYSYFDAAIRHYLTEAGVLDIHCGEIVGLAVETQCRFFKPLSFPETVDAGLRVGKLDQSCVRYEIGLFSHADDECAAAGHFVHVFVDRKTRRPTPMTDALRQVLAEMQLPSAEGCA